MKYLSKEYCLHRIQKELRTFAILRKHNLDHAARIKFEQIQGLRESYKRLFP
jgi:hypothetical protein